MSTANPTPGKRGLCWPVENNKTGDSPVAFTKPGSKITWLYNWSPHPTPGTRQLHFVPMQWNHANADELPSHCQRYRPSALLAFNEPELDSQSNMPVPLAVDTWMQHIHPLRQAGLVRAGSPGVSSSPHGVTWLKEFLAGIRARGSDVDFYALHWYGLELGHFYDYIWSTYYQLGPDKPVWITEFAPTNWDVANPLGKEHVENFCRESCKYLEGLEWVERYAFFGAMRDTGTVGRWARMLDDQGKLTDLGRIYRDE